MRTASCRVSGYYSGSKLSSALKHITMAKSTRLMTMGQCSCHPDTHLARQGTGMTGCRSIDAVVWIEFRYDESPEFGRCRPANCN
jgi:hypothetical protein